MSAIRGVAPAVVVILMAAAAWLAAATPAMAQLTDADVYVAEATLAIEDKQWDRALDLLRQALAKEPDHVEALYYTGVAYMGKRQPAEAVKYGPAEVAGRHLDRLSARPGLRRARAVRPGAAAP